MISGSSAFSKSSLNIWKFTVHVLLKPDLENFEHYFTSMWDECNCVAVSDRFQIGKGVCQGCMLSPCLFNLYESWTVKKAERWRIDAFELRCWRRLLRVPWIAKRSNQSILKETSPGCSLVGLMLKLKRQYFGHLMRSIDSLEKTLMLGGIGGRRRGQQRMRWLYGITDSVDVSLSEL